MQQNLARAWRSKNFDEIVGQELSVRLLKNSLAKNRLFPVYLFSGLRGSGKTSTGRIFAAAINCHALKNFQHDQTQSLPCLTCESCMSMRAGNHPDFVEIDAASHTGVDNIRQIIESASFLPVMGSKKVYLIDEAHMLSKAAFNAFLKILEEPPATVVFLLATTEVHKILDTVISRSFQLFFDPIPQAQMIAHLKRICVAEQIEYEESALALIAQQSEGSVRDALTIMERIMLAEGDVSYAGTHRALGLLHDAVVIKLFELIAQGDLSAVFGYMVQEHFDRHNAARVWDNMVAVLRALVWAHNGGMQASDGGYSLDVASLQSAYSAELVLEFFDLFYRAEAHFLKTSSQQAVLETLLCKMVQRFNAGTEGAQEPVRRQAPVSKKIIEQRPVRQHVQEATHVNEKTNPLTLSDSEGIVSKGKSVTDAASHVAPVAMPQHNSWNTFLQELEAKNHPIAISIFKQGHVVKVEQNVIHVRFAKKFEFYHDWMRTNEPLWRPPLEAAFGAGIVFTPEFVVAAAGSSAPEQVQASKAPAPEMRRPISHEARPVQASQEKIDITDTEKWRMANMVTEMFPGTITTRKE